jgi:hypothetical protein
MIYKTKFSRWLYTSITTVLYIGGFGTFPC